MDFFHVGKITSHLTLRQGIFSIYKLLSANTNYIGAKSGSDLYWIHCLKLIFWWILDPFFSLDLDQKDPFFSLDLDQSLDPFLKDLLQVWLYKYSSKTFM